MTESVYHPQGALFEQKQSFYKSAMSQLEKATNKPFFKQENNLSGGEVCEALIEVVFQRFLVSSCVLLDRPGEQQQRRQTRVSVRPQQHRADQDALRDPESGRAS